MANEPASILIIEDDLTFRSLALQAFEGFNKATASNAEDGFKKFKELCPDITLLDIGLPDKSGLELLPELLEYDPEAYIVMLTASNMSFDVAEAKAKGAVGYITKPFSYSKVRECINSYKSFKRALENMTPEERAKDYIKNLQQNSIEKIIERTINHDEAVTVQRHIAKHELKEIIVKNKDYAYIEPFSEEVSEILHDWQILFADGFAANRDRARRKLATFGCHVAIARHYHDVIDKAAQEEYNMIFLDAQIPGKGGYFAAKEIKKIYFQKDIDVIIVGMIEEKKEIDEGLWKKAGMDDYIKKPTKFSMLRDMIEKHINKQIEEERKKLLD